MANVDRLDNDPGIIVLFNEQNIHRMLGLHPAPQVPNVAQGPTPRDSLKQLTTLPHGHSRSQHL